RSNWAGFVLVPVAFSIILVLILYLALAPTVMPVVDLFNLFLSEEKQTNTIPTNQFQGLHSALENNKDGILLSEFTYPEVGAYYGEVTIEGTTLKTDLLWGDSNKELNAGAGTYTGAWLPGFDRTVLLAGHSMTAFYELGDAKLGSIITVKTYYGEYHYKITDMQVKEATDETAYDFSRTDENIILYTCYPFHGIGFTPTRYFVYGKYIDGPKIIDDSKD
ncbi:MAG: class D sortase, partial [Oscillospiraceae bacterium]